MSVEGDIEALETKYRELTTDIDPQELREYVRQLLEDANHTPALLALLAGHDSGNEPDTNEVAGLQFVHHGLHITHSVLHDDSWTDPGSDPNEEDMLLLCADVLVATGFDNLLDHYDAVTRIVNEFGTNEARALSEAGYQDHLAAQYIETYRTAVKIGAGDPREPILELAENLAHADSTAETGGDPDPYLRDADTAARDLHAGVKPYLDRIKAEKGLGRPAGIEVQD